MTGIAAPNPPRRYGLPGAGLVVTGLAATGLPVRGGGS
jgi:hypothetical protein